MVWAISCPWKTNIATWWHSFSCASVANVYWFAWYSQVIGLHFLGFIYHVCHYTIHINLITKITALKKCKLMLLYWFQSSVLFNKLWIKNYIFDIRFESTLAGIQYTLSTGVLLVYLVCTSQMKSTIQVYFIYALKLLIKKL